LGLLGPDPDPSVRGMDPGLLSPSKKGKKNLDSYCFVTYFLLFIFENDVHVPPDPLVKRHGSADPDPDPDPPQNVMDPQH